MKECTKNLALSLCTLDFLLNSLPVQVELYNTVAKMSKLGCWQFSHLNKWSDLLCYWAPAASTELTSKSSRSYRCSAPLKIRHVPFRLSSSYQILDAFVRSIWSCVSFTSSSWFWKFWPKGEHSSIHLKIEKQFCLVESTTKGRRSPWKEKVLDILKYVYVSVTK